MGVWEALKPPILALIISFLVLRPWVEKLCTVKLHIATVLRTVYTGSSTKGKITMSLNRLASLKIRRFIFVVAVYTQYKKNYL